MGKSVRKIVDFAHFCGASHSRQRDLEIACGLVRLALEKKLDNILLVLYFICVVSED